MPPTRDDWSKSAEHIRKSLERLERGQEAMQRDVQIRHEENLKAMGETNAKIASLQVKSGLTGMLGGAIVATGAVLMSLFKNKTI